MIEYISETGVEVKQIATELFKISFNSELVNLNPNDAELGRVIREALLDTVKYLKQNEKDL